MILYFYEEYMDGGINSSKLLSKLSMVILFHFTYSYRRVVVPYCG